jgi:hypothetical protein
VVHGKILWAVRKQSMTEKKKVGRPRKQKLPSYAIDIYPELPENKRKRKQASPGSPSPYDWPLKSVGAHAHRAIINYKSSSHSNTEMARKELSHWSIKESMLDYKNMVRALQRKISDYLAMPMQPEDELIWRQLNKAFFNKK